MVGKVDKDIVLLGALEGFAGADGHLLAGQDVQEDGVVHQVMGVVLGNAMVHLKKKQKYISFLIQTLVCHSVDRNKKFS